MVLTIIPTSSNAVTDELLEALMSQLQLGRAWLISKAATSANDIALRIAQKIK
jgi:hypothetical protein